MGKLQDKIVVVTGGSGLLGSAYLDQIKAEGGIVVNADISVATDFSKGELSMDIASEASMLDGIEAVYKEFGRIDGWVNNAYPRTKDWGAFFEDIPLESWKENVDLQMNSTMYCCQQVLKRMKQVNYGSIVNIASIYGVGGPDFTIYEGLPMTMPAAYSAIKGGIINFSRYLAAYYGPHNLRVNVVSPGGIFDHQREEFVERYEARVPMKRLGTPKDIAPGIAFLLSDEAQYITGQNLIIDGGWTAI